MPCILLVHLLSAPWHLFLHWPSAINFRFPAPSPLSCFHNLLQSARTLCVYPCCRSDFSPYFDCKPWIFSALILPLQTLSFPFYFWRWSYVWTCSYGWSFSIASPKASPSTAGWDFSTAIRTSVYTSIAPEIVRPPLPLDTKLKITYCL